MSVQLKKFSNCLINLLSDVEVCILECYMVQSRWTEVFVLESVFGSIFNLVMEIWQKIRRIVVQFREVVSVYSCMAWLDRYYRDFCKYCSMGCETVYVAVLFFLCTVGNAVFCSEIFAFMFCGCQVEVRWFLSWF